MSSTTSVVVVERGQDFSLAFDVASPDGHAVDLSGYSLAGSLTRDGSAIASLACSLSGTSRVEAALDAASTAALAPGQCRYSINATAPGAAPTLIAEGPAVVVPLDASSTALVASLVGGTASPFSIDASSLTGTIAAGRLAGAYPGVTGVGTLTSGSIGAGFSVDAGSLTGTIASARLTGSYAGIAGVGTLTSGAIGAGFTPIPVSALASLSPADVGLGSVTDDAQTKAAIVPNTPPAAGQVLVGNGTSYAPVAIGGDATLSSAGALTVTKTSGTAFGPLATSTDASNLTGTIASARLTGSYAGITGVGTLGSLSVSGSFTVGSSGSGTGGNIRLTSDDGSQRWLAGLLGVPSAKNWSLYDLVNATTRVSVDASTGSVSLLSNVASVSAGTGALVVTGGAGVGADLNVGGGLSVTGALSVKGVSGTIGSGSSLAVLYVSGSGSGTNGGAYLSIQNGGSGLLLLGNKSAVFNGAYDATPYVYSPSTIHVYNALTIDSTTTSSNTATGALVVGGGLGVGSAGFFGGNLSTAGQLYCGKSGSGTGGSLRFTSDDGTQRWSVGLLGTVGAKDYTVYDLVNSASRLVINANTGAVSVLSTTSSTTTGTGALVVSGGAGVGGNLNVGGSLNVSQSTGSWAAILNKSSGVANDLGVLIAAGPNSSSDTSTLLLGFYPSNYPSSSIGSVTRNGLAVAFNTTSDRDLKEDGRPFDGASVIRQLQVWDFRWKGTERRECGVFAQDAYDIYPPAVRPPRREGEYWQADYSKYVPLNIRATQQALELIAELERRVAALERPVVQ